MKSTDSFEEQLPDELRALHDELASIGYEERPSFAPELRTELVRARATGPAPDVRLGVRRILRPRLAAAAVAVGLLCAVAVPSARAALVAVLDVIVPPAPADPVLPAPPREVPVAVESAPSSAPPTIEPPRVLEEPAPVAAPTVVAEPVVVAPEMLNRLEAQRALRAAYPMHLQRRGVGGTVWLQVWVDESGATGAVEVSRPSGVSELDRVAARVAPRFRFIPALQDGRPTGTWIEFPVLFEPDPDRIERTLEPVGDPLSLPTLDASLMWQRTVPFDVTAPGRPDAVARVARARAEAVEQLARALPDADFVAAYGPAEAILAGEAPEGAPPTEWRAAVGAAFSDAIEAGVGTPASMLALGRIRMRQGLRAEARSLFERGLQRAIAERGAATPWVLAELHAERGDLLRARWLGADGVGRVRSEAFADSECTAARTSGRAASGYASVDRLVAWNYLCPMAMGGIFAAGFVETAAGSAGDLALMMASYRAALEAYPGHPRASTMLLLTFAAKGRWDDVLAGARSYAHASGGHPDALLLAGLALHRLGRSEEAAQRFEAALTRMPEEEADRLEDVAVLLEPADAGLYRSLSLAERRAWQASYWAARDRTPSTAVNERWVEHMARTSHAQLRFGDLFGDAAEVWVRFGRPNHVHVVVDGTGRLTEFWDYGSGPDITFVRWAPASRTDLTAEGRAYVDDLGSIFPPQ